MLRARWIAVCGLLAGFWVLGSPGAAAKGFYYGGTLGRSEAKRLGFDRIGDGSVLTGKTDGTDNAWKIFAGFKVMRFVNAEFTYRDYGQVSYSAMSDGSGTVYAAGPVDGVGDTKAIGITAMAVLPAGPFSFFVKGGISRWRTEATVRHSVNKMSVADSDGTDSVFGVGAAWDYTGPGGLRLEFERISMSVGDQDFISAGVHFRF